MISVTETTGKEVEVKQLSVGDALKLLVTWIGSCPSIDISSSTYVELTFDRSEESRPDRIRFEDRSGNQDLFYLSNVAQWRKDSRILQKASSFLRDLVKT